MTISAEAQAIIDSLKADMSKLAEQNTQLVDAQVSSAMQVRDAEAVALCERLKLPGTEIEVNFAEVGEKEATAKTAWKPFLVSLSEQQFRAFGELASGLAKSSTQGDGGLMFSEFDKPEGGSTNGTTPLELSEGDAKKLNARINEQRAKALTAYSTGRPMA